MLTLLALTTLAFAGPHHKKNHDGDSAAAADNANAADAGKTASDAPPPVKVSGVIFARYDYLMSLPGVTGDAANYNEFALDRAYFRADATINEHLGVRVTLDADHIKPISGTDSTGASTSTAIDSKYRVFVKHAYLEWKDMAPGVKGRAGVIDTPLGPYLDDFWGGRYIADNFAAYAVKMPTADLGIGAYGNYNKGLLDWAAVLVNGEGYNNLEVDAGKTFEGRLSVDPLSGPGKMQLPITGYFSYAMNPDSDQVMIASGVVGFSMPYLLLNGQFLLQNTAVKGSSSITGQGFSVIVMPRVPKVAALILRYDQFDPDTATDLDGKSQLIAGVAHNFAPKVSLAATYERQSTEAATDLPGQGIFLHMQAGW